MIRQAKDGINQDASLYLCDLFGLSVNDYRNHRKGIYRLLSYTVYCRAQNLFAFFGHITDFISLTVA